MATKRLNSELRDLNENPPDNFSAGPVYLDHKRDLFHWEATLIGPEDSLYSGGIFFLDINFSKDHPFRPPKIKFTTKIYHPNISAKGEIMDLDILEDKWNPTITIRQVFNSIIALLIDPKKPKSAPLYFPIRHRYGRKKTRNHWDNIDKEMARAWTTKYGKYDDDTPEVEMRKYIYNRHNDIRCKGVEKPTSVKKKGGGSGCHMYETIVNPKTGRKVSIFGRIGKNVLSNYMLKIGGINI